MPLERREGLVADRPIGGECSIEITGENEIAHGSVTPRIAERRNARATAPYRRFDGKVAWKRPMESPRLGKVLLTPGNIDQPDPRRVPYRREREIHMMSAANRAR